MEGDDGLDLAGVDGLPDLEIFTGPFEPSVFPPNISINATDPVT